MRTKTNRQIAEEKSAKRKVLESIYGEDVRLSERDVVRLWKRYEIDGIDYNPIAIKVDDDNWYMGGEYMSWGDLLFELDRDNLYENDPSLLEVATGWRPVSNEPPF